MSLPDNLKLDSLESVSIEKLTETICIAFADYSIKMPSDPLYWKTRFEAARVDYKLSQGVFDQNELIAFVVNAVDLHQGELAAYNTGTGVFPKHRGNQFVDKIYKYSIPIFKDMGIKKCLLEVIDDNERAIKVYERIGFRKIKLLKSYSGELPAYEDTKLSLKEFQLEQLKEEQDEVYAWDFRKATVLKLADKYRAFRVYKAGTEIGYFVIRADTATLAQYETLDNDWESLFTGVAMVSNKIRLINVDENRKDLISYLVDIELSSLLNQNEMEMYL